MTLKGWVDSREVLRMREGITKKGPVRKGSEVTRSLQLLSSPSGGGGTLDRGEPQSTQRAPQLEAK